MALRLNKTVLRGEIDNRQQGRITGKIWLTGRKEPIRLDLKGNCLRDIAGYRIAFENPFPEPGNKANCIHHIQEGAVGDMTASRKVKTMDIDGEIAYKMQKAGHVMPVRIANCLYLEWYSRQNGRVVIELTNFRVKELSDPEWRMTREEEQKQSIENQNTIHNYMEEISQNTAATMLDWDTYEVTPMDEFEWEKRLKESDALTEEFSKVFDKYVDHPEGEKLMAREMGWDWLDDALDADERGVFEEEMTDMEKEMEDFSPLEANPLTEGVDWVRTEDGDIQHPLSHHAFELVIAMWNKCKDRGLLENDRDVDLHEMLFQSQTLGAKLAGALDSLAYDHQPEGGFIVACLKRALLYFDRSIAASNKVRAKKLLDRTDLEEFRKELFAIRQEMLALMKRYRSI